MFYLPTVSRPVGVIFLSLVTLSVSYAIIMAAKKEKMADARQHLSPHGLGGWIN
jgi:hypothetical protein